MLVVHVFFVFLNLDICTVFGFLATIMLSKPQLFAFCTGLDRLFKHGPVNKELFF